MRSDGLAAPGSSADLFPSPAPEVRCLLQSTAAHPALEAGLPPEGLLAPVEQARCDQFKVAKRRRDWLLGRWTAKHLVRAHLLDAEGQPLALERSLSPGARHPAQERSLSAGGRHQAQADLLEIDDDRLALNHIIIGADGDGAPYAALAQGVDEERLQLSLSISHAGTLSFCALCSEPGLAAGADVERVEPREGSFVETFFAAEEADAVRACPAERRATLITAIWSGKEAALKALRTGLRADPRQVQCLPRAAGPCPSVPSPCPSVSGAWAPLSLSLGAGLAPERPFSLSSWWLDLGEYVLTLALLSTSPAHGRPARIA